MKFILFILILTLSRCQVSWYVKGISENEKIVSIESIQLQGLKKTINLCLVSNLRFQPPLHPKKMVSLDSFELNLSRSDYRIQSPAYSGLDPEFLLFLKERLKSHKNILIKTQLFGLPERFREKKSFELLKTPKTLDRYETIVPLGQTDNLTADILKSYFDIVDMDTELLYGSENPFSHDIVGCGSYLYVTKYTPQQDSYNSLLFFISLGLIPKFQTQNHYYDVIYRPVTENVIHKKTFVFGHRKGHSWLFLPTLGLLDSVSTFDKNYPFAEESEEMFLDSVTEVMERSL